MNIRGGINLFLKGMGMGAADVVPGVSGGTIAFITGIYEELIYSIKSIDHTLLQVVKDKGLSAAWSHINGNFLMIVFAGILASIFSLARIIGYLLQNEPVLIWSFFFGLIVASAVYVARTIPSWNMARISVLAAGIAIACGINTLAPVEGPDTLWFLFLAGTVAICAMILPGISGSFILLLMGAYSLVLGNVNSLTGALAERNTAVLLASGLNLFIFALGCLIGLVTFSHLLSWMFNKAESLTLSLLTGFMVGSLGRVWPWKHTLETRIDSHGVEVPLVQENVLPGAYQSLAGEPARTAAAIGLAAAALALVLLLEHAGKRRKSS